MMMILTNEELHQRFFYDDGKLFLKQKTTKMDTCRAIGSEVGTIQKNGRRYVKIDGKATLVHRIIFQMHHNYLPKFIDHIDGNPLNNKIDNLRECLHSENSKNRVTPKNNTSGVKGVDKSGNKWKVRIGLNFGRLYLGTYDDLELAELVAIEGRNKYHKQFASHR
jgi:hypothetical protein